MTLFILTHIKRFFIMFQTNYWTDVFSSACSPTGARARPVRFPALQSCSHEEHIKCSSARAELATNLTGRARAPVGEQAAETRSVQSNIVGTEFWLRICSRQRLNGQFPLCPSGSCGEIGTDFAVETFKQSLFHRTLQKGMKKGGGSEWSPRLCYRGRWYSRVAGLDQTGVDRLGDLGGVGGTLDGGTEVLVHERLGDLGQDLEVRSAGLGTRD